MNFSFFDAADHPLFSRNDVEEATHTHEEMSLYLLFPYKPEKVIQRGMRVGYTDSLGVFQAFEIRKTKLYEPDHYQEITAEHIVISELTDEFCEAKEWTDITAQAALADLLTGTLWSVGTVTSSGQSSGNVSIGNVWQNIRTIENNWNVYIIPRVTVAASGITGRYLDIVPAGGAYRGLRFSLEKNMDETGVTWDDTRLKTALYGFGKAVEVEGEDENQPLTFANTVWTKTADHPAKPAGQAYLEDPDATAAYGRNGRARFGYYQNGNISDPEILLQKTWETLKTVSVPDVSIDSTVKNLQALGNVAEVPIRLHDTAIIEIRPTSVLLQKEVIRYTEDLLNPLNDRVTIGDYIPNIIYINRETAERSGGGGGSGGQTDLEYKITEFDTEIAANLYEISLRAYQRDMNNVEEILRQAGISIDAGGVITYADDNPNMLQAKFNVQAAEISSKVSAGNIASEINQTAQSVLISAQKIDLQGYVTASQLSAEIASIENAWATSIATDWLSAGLAEIELVRISTALSVNARFAQWQQTTIGGVTLHYLGEAPT